MSEKFTVFTGVMIYNEAGEILMAKRSSNEQNTPGIFSYVGGKMEFNTEAIDTNSESILNSAENNIKKEVEEEVNIEIENFQYIHSHNFVKENGDKVFAIIFMAKILSGVPTPDMNEITECIWIKENEIDAINSIPIVKMIYKLGFEALKNRQYHEHIEVAGIVLNEKNEFLVLKEAATGHYVFPHGSVENLPGRTWDILEKNLMRNIFSQTGIEITEGMIPFTDTEFLGKDGFEKIIQFFICKYSSGELTVTDPFKYSEVTWMGIDKMDENHFKPLVLNVFKKAFEFINRINN